MTNLENLAYIDELTGLRTYAKCFYDAETLLAENHGEKKYAIWGMDIKGFNDINDIFGHDMADKFLKYLAQFFKDEETEDKFACRIAADNFAGIRPYDTKKDLIDFFNQIKKCVLTRDFMPESEKKMDFSVGMYCIDEVEHNLSGKEMASHTTIARKKARELAGTNMVFFTKEMSDKLKWESELEANAQQALNNGELTFMLQPKVSLQGRFKVSGAEALARWNHPEHGMISPADFIPVFEHNGFIVNLDRYIFKEACKWLAGYKKRTGCSINLAVNVSRQGFMRGDIVSYYSKTKNEFGIENGVLELEFTESVFVDDYKLFRDTVVDLQREGFICAIDDFGAGYSSLNILKSLPIDVLKLDALFMRDGESKRTGIIVRDFIAMAHKLDIVTVAEGVETEEQVEYLVGAKCDVAQGYVFSPPIPVDDFVRFLDKYKDGLIL